MKNEGVLVRPTRVITTVALLVCAGGFPQLADAQTFVQLTDLGDGIGSRLTRAVTLARINRMVFGATKGKVTYIDLATVYQFTADPVWKRVIVWKKDTWTHAFTNEAGPGGGLSDPAGVDISARRKFYLADRGNGWILYGTFDPAVGNIVNPAAFRGSFVHMPYLKEPVDVAWDGQTNPLTTDFIYVLDRQNSVVSYWNLNNTPAKYPDWAYGAIGTGTGQFRDPASVCVGKTPSSSGGTQFTANFYVVDNGNKRLVWLNRVSGGAGWQMTASLANWDPVDCAVDHFGNVYVADRANHRIHKFTSGLTLLASYGSYGVGTSMNTFKFPHAISVPCGLKVVNSQSVWYCEGRVVTAEEWGDQSGAVEHYLGVDGWYTSTPDAPPNTGSAFISYTTTEVASTTIDVHQVGVGTIRTLTTNQLRGAGGGWGVYWDGAKTDGARAPDGTYRFRVMLWSAYQCGTEPCFFRSLHSPDFYFDNCDPSAGGPVLTAPIGVIQRQVAPPGDGTTEPCSGTGGNSPPVGDAAPDAEPTTLFLRQRVLSTARPLARVTGLPSPTAAGQPAELGALSSLVREFGVRGLAFSITRELSSSPVTIRVHSMSGRSVRTLLKDILAPGVYEIGWDGLDDRGRPAGPGVYFAVLTAGGQRLVQRLILRQAP